MARIPTRDRVSAGGVVFRQLDGKVEVALIAVLAGDERGDIRWQLPKGLVGRNEAPEETAIREVREETGLNGDIIAPLDNIEYWYYGATRQGHRLRFHKVVHYYLLSFSSGSTADHDHEVKEARWFEIDEAIEQLAFENEKGVVRLAQERIDSL